MTVVLDSWAVMRMLEGTEPTASRVEREIDKGTAVMSWINLGEVLYVLQRLHGASAAKRTIQDIESQVTVVLPDRGLVLTAAEIKATYPMSYADAFAAATAIQYSAALWTGDPELLVSNATWKVSNPAKD